MAEPTTAPAPATAGEAETAGVQAPETNPTAAPPGLNALDETPATRLAVVQPLALPTRLTPPVLDEEPFTPPSPPPPFGVEFTLGPDGLVEPTPEGALTPDGIIVRSGRPAVVPAPRPAGLVPDGAALPVPEASAVVAALEAATEPAPQADDPAPQAAAPVSPTLDETARADPVLAGFRPQPRAVPPVTGDAATGDDGAALDPDTTTDAPTPGAVSLLALRPQPRPSDLSAPSLVRLPETDLPDTDAIEEGVIASLMPPARPGDLRPRAEPAAVAAAPAASAGPQIPTSASVAERATQSRAINLRQINLIGVFGTPSDRRALVRLSDGRVVRLQVGDTLDGGRVSAIGEDELRYTRSGRNEVLRIGSS